MWIVIALIYIYIYIYRTGELVRGRQGPRGVAAGKVGGRHAGRAAVRAGRAEADGVGVELEGPVQVVVDCVIHILYIIYYTYHVLYMYHVLYIILC